MKSAEMKWYNVEIPYNTVKSIRRADSFREWLYNNNFKNEPSSCGNLVHFEILASEKDLSKINKALDRIVWPNAIWEQ